MYKNKEAKTKKKNLRKREKNQKINSRNSSLPHLEKKRRGRKGKQEKPVIERSELEKKSEQVLFENASKGTGKLRNRC